MFDGTRHCHGHHRYHHHSAANRQHASMINAVSQDNRSSMQFLRRPRQKTKKLVSLLRRARAEPPARLLKAEKGHADSNNNGCGNRSNHTPKENASHNHTPKENASHNHNDNEEPPPLPHRDLHCYRLVLFWGARRHRRRALISDSLRHGSWVPR